MMRNSRVMSRMWLCWLVLILPGIGDVQATTKANFPSSRAVTDATGRTITLPLHVNRVVTIGPVPVLNSFIFALKKGSTIINGLPLFAQTGRHKFQRIFAPSLVNQPTIQGPSGDISLESLLTLRPDVIFTLDPATAKRLEGQDIPVMVLAWRDAQDIKNTIVLLGEVYERQAEADGYVKYFDGVMRRVAERVPAVSEKERPHVLFWSLRAMTQPHLVADWWINQAGGNSVTDDKRTMESVSFSIEHVLAWNPDILIMSRPGEIEEVYRDPRLTSLKAVQGRRVYSIPVGAHPWGYRTVEQPLCILWAAKLFHPHRFAELNLESEMKEFYSRFFGYHLSEEEVLDMLSGIP